MDNNQTQAQDLFQLETSISNYDKSIYYNIILQLIICAVLAIAFLILRVSFKKLYMKNIFGRPSHPCSNYTSFFNFIWPIFTINDKELLLLCGLDSFILLMTLKLFIKIFAILSVLVSLPLLILYGMRVTNTDFKGQLFYRFSIENIEKNPYILSFPVFLLYVTTFIIIYFIFIQSKKLIALRQAYIRNPASLMSLTTLRINENLFNGKIEDIIRHINMPAKTVLIKNLPPFITNRKELTNFFENINIGKVKEAVLINPSNNYRTIENERKKIVNKIEKKIEEIFPGCPKKTFSMNRSKKEKRRLFLIFLKKHDDQLKTDIEVLKEKLKPADSTHLSEIKIEPVKVQNQITENFFQLKEVFLSKKTVDSSFFDLPVIQQHAFITFEHQRSASIAAQCLLSLSLFQLKCKMAPRPKDIIWKSFSLPIYSKFFFKFFSNVFYFVYCFFFISLALFLINNLLTKELLKNIFSYDFLDSIVVFISGIIGPIVYNLLLTLSPYIIYMSIKLKQYNSVSKENMELLKKNTTFLLYAAILGIFCGTTLLEILRTAIKEYKTDFDVLFNTLHRDIMAIALLFTNTIIQKIFVGSLSILIKYSNLLKLFIKSKTSRDKFLSYIPDPIHFDVIYSSILLVLPMILIYTVICPFMILLGLAYFLISYGVFKYDFLYASHNRTETGGNYWNFFTHYLIYVLILSQTITCFYFIGLQKKIMGLLCALLMFLTAFFGLPLVDKYTKICKYYPINLMEEQYITNFSSNVLSSHMTKLKKWTDESDNFFHDSILFKDLDWQQDRTKHLNLYYDPTVISMYDRLLLPVGFYDMVENKYS